MSNLILLKIELDWVVLDNFIGKEVYKLMLIIAQKGDDLYNLFKIHADMVIPPPNCLFSGG